jgi:hypothetical protein
MTDFKSEYSELIAGTEDILREAIVIYNRLVPLIQEEMAKISSANTIDDIRSCMKYAILYYDIRNAYKVLRKMDIVNKFIENRSAITDIQDMRWILSGVRYLHKYNTLWKDYNMYGPIRETKQFPYFDPTTHFVQKRSNTYNYGLLYGQSILFMLSREKPDDVLIHFIKECITKIVELSDDVVQHHYSLFSDKLLELSDTYMFGGGASVEKDTYWKICDYMLYYLEHLPIKHMYLPIVTLSVFLPIQSICLSLIEHIILTYNVQYTPYMRTLMNILKYEPLSETQQRIWNFLKRVTRKTRKYMKVQQLIYVGGKTRRYNKGKISVRRMPRGF